MKTTVYSDADLNAVYEQKRLYVHIFTWVTVVYLAICIASVIYFSSLPYGDKALELPKTVVYSLSAAYIVFAFLFMGIKYNRVRRYFKMVYFLSEGLKITEQNYFVCFAKKDLQKDNVDVVSCVFRSWNKKKCEWMEREVYIDVEKPFPDFEEGDYVRYVTQSNFLLQYEVLERGVFDEEVAKERA